MGFEPTLPKKTELESVALDHSATDAFFSYCMFYTVFAKKEKHL